MGRQYSEGQLRRWVSSCHDDTYWVEPSSGSTSGLPDAYLVKSGMGLWVELKAAEWSRGECRFNLRASQKQVLKSFELNKIPSCVLLVVKTTAAIWAARPGPWCYNDKRLIVDGMRTNSLMMMGTLYQEKKALFDYLYEFITGSTDCLLSRIEDPN